MIYGLIDTFERSDVIAESHIRKCDRRMKKKKTRNKTTRNIVREADARVS